MDQLFISVAEACRALGLGKTTIYSLINDKRLDARKLGRRTLITIASVRCLLEAE